MTYTIMTDQLYCQDEAASIPTEEERRASARLRSGARAVCQKLSEVNGRPWPCEIRDVSPFGIGLCCSQPLQPGVLLNIELLNKAGNTVTKIRGRVIHAREANQMWSVGCAFVGEIDNDTLKLFHAEKIQPAGTDGRRWVRFPCNVETVFYTQDTAPGESRSARILNISGGGIGLVLPCEFSPGTLLNIELLGEGVVLIRVVRTCDQGNGNWFLGCEFTDQLTPDELQELV
jgi:hypothetical protein